MSILQRCLLLFALCAALVGVAAHPLAAGTISLEISASARMDEEIAIVDISATNHGDEAARDVQPQIYIGGARGMGEVLPVLDPEQPHTWSITFVTCLLPGLAT